MHMPQFEAALLSGLGRLRRRGRGADLSVRPPAAARRVQSRRRGQPAARSIAWRPPRRTPWSTTSDDYAHHSRISVALCRQAARHRAADRLARRRSGDATAQLAPRWQLDRGVHIGFAARFAAEKGVEYLLQALPAVLDAIPDARVVFTGAYKDTVGEEEYWQRLAPLLERYRRRSSSSSCSRAEAMPSFFALCDVIAVTSLNSTEAFGMVQVEAMLCGTPVVATDLPGVREPVRRTGMGRLVPPRDSTALAAALIEVIRTRSAFARPRAAIAAEFDVDRSLREYEALFEKYAVGMRAERVRMGSSPVSASANGEARRGPLISPDTRWRRGPSPWFFSSPPVSPDARWRRGPPSFYSSLARDCGCSVSPLHLPRSQRCSRGRNRIRRR